VTKPKAVKFKGVRKKPIEVEIMRPDNWPNKNISSELKKRWEEKADITVRESHLYECRQKLSYLFAHYRIEDQNNFESLALHLAIDFVNGFRLIEIPLKLAHGDYGAVVPVKPSSAGAPKFWTKERLLALFDAVQLIKEQQKISSDRDALNCLRIIHHKDWGTSSGSAGPGEWLETLEARLQDAKIEALKFQNARAAALELLKQEVEIKKRIQSENL